MARGYPRGATAEVGRDPGCEAPQSWITALFRTLEYPKLPTTPSRTRSKPRRSRPDQANFATATLLLRSRACASTGEPGYANVRNG
jgi:hypothetical protein